VIGNSLGELYIGDEWPGGVAPFFAGQAFLVDGIRYDPGRRTNVSQSLMGQKQEHDCFETPGVGPCGFDYGVDDEFSSSDPYRWAPGMVYYRSTEFDTPRYGEADGQRHVDVQQMRDDDIRCD
jgi:hypothetical protein